MGIFSNLFNKNKNDQDKESEEELPIFYAQKDSKMQQAIDKARSTFKYFWRELSWEHRRIIPAHGFACVKVTFTQQFEGDDTPVTEHMWINEISFDGATIYGILVNQPNALTNIKQGDAVTISMEEITDWMISIAGKTYGGFTIQAMRSDMSEQERKAHDEAWGLDFGDYEDILTVFEEKENPQNLIEHPMSINMKEKLEEFLQENPDEIHKKYDNGYTMLINETIAGNKSSVEILIKAGADVNVKTDDEKTALDYAKLLNWEHLIPVLEQ
ncbi:DUF2314 domain-containing protein [Aquimarina aquimarini]|uniref:DUF2314 domain-containing protein n=1 Tax=Aquimarina aquimarini TaxID=1191734 RepID=UPI001F160AD4|nr:DUF2314 domain-containing protein [Aquimarina aquimarini]